MTIARIALMSLFLGLPVVMRLSAQVPSPSTRTSIHIVSEPSGAHVFIHDTLAGVTPFDYPIAGTDSIVSYFPSRAAWNGQCVVLRGPFVSAEDGVVVVRFQSFITVNSIPPGALVRCRDSVFGVTPLVSSVLRVGDRIEVRKTGYHDETVEIRSDTSVTLVFLHQEAGLDGFRDLSVHESSHKSPSAIVWVASGIGLAAGVAAVVLKQHADGIYDEYTRTGDPSLRDKTHRYDIRAGISLGVMQASLAYLVYLLFTEK